MKTEYEVRVLEIDKAKMIETLENLGAKKNGDWHQKRYVYDIIPKSENSWIRLRTNGIKTTLAFKSVETKTIDGTKEVEVEVSNFEDTNTILNQMGYYAKGFQENKRIQYILDDVEIDIDTWPKIPTYLEIEGKDKESVNKIIQKMNIEQSKISTLDVQSLYKHYGYDEINDLKFEEE